MNLLRDNPPLNGRRVTVMGLGRFGGAEGLIRYLTGQGARVTVTDRGPAEALSETRNRLSGLTVDFHLDGHRSEHFDDADLIVVNPAVPDDSTQTGPPIGPGADLGERKGVATSLYWLHPVSCRRV